MIEELSQRREEIEQFCRRFRVRRLEVFGSAIGGGFRAGESDMDFLVEFASSALSGYADQYFGLLESLEALFGRPVDLIVVSAIRNPHFRQSVETTKVLMHGS